MNITNIKLTIRSVIDEGLAAYCTVTFDHEFVIHDIRIVRRKTRLIVSMPSRKASAPCPDPGCRIQNFILAKYCSACGLRLDPQPVDENVQIYIDVAHPITPAMRGRLEAAIIAEYDVQRSVLLNGTAHAAHHDNRPTCA